jgi:hypothetical protein
LSRQACLSCGLEPGTDPQCPQCWACSPADVRGTSSILVVHAAERLPGGVCWLCGAPGDCPQRSYRFVHRSGNLHVLDHATHQLSRLLVPDDAIDLRIPICERCDGIQSGRAGRRLLLAGIAGLVLSLVLIGRAMLSGALQSSIPLGLAIGACLAFLAGVGVWSEWRRIRCVRIDGPTATLIIPRAARVRAALRRRP